MQKQALQGDRAYDRLLAMHIPSRGERRRLRKRLKTVRDEGRRIRTAERAMDRAKATLLREAADGGEGRTVINLRSWKQASRIASAGGNLWIRARVILKRFGSKRKRYMQGKMESNAVRHERVLDGKLMKVTDDKDERKVRYISRGLAKKIMHAGLATSGPEAK